MDGDSLSLSIGGDDVRGRFSGRIAGKDVALTRRGERLSGRIGGHVDGKDVTLNLGDVPLEIAALAAVCTYKALEDTQQQSAAASSSGGAN